MSKWVKWVSHVFIRKRNAVIGISTNFKYINVILIKVSKWDANINWNFIRDIYLDQLCQQNFHCLVSVLLTTSLCCLFEHLLHKVNNHSLFFVQSHFIPINVDVACRDYLNISSKISLLQDFLPVLSVFNKHC